MNGFMALLRKEFMEFRRTWRVWVLPGLFIFLAVTGVFTARFTQELMETLAPAGVGGVHITVPDPTWRDTLAQWNKGLSQIGLIAVLLAGGGMISAERRQGSQVMIITKPVSRWSYVLAKFTATAVSCTAAVAVGAAVELIVARVLFADSQVLPLLQLTAVWLLSALVLLAVTLLGSAAFDSPLAASGLGLGAMLSASLASLWGPAATYSPAGLTRIGGELVAGAATHTAWPIVTAVSAVCLLVVVAAKVFASREL